LIQVQISFDSGARGGDASLQASICSGRISEPPSRGRFSYVEGISESAKLSKNRFNKDEFIEYCKLLAKPFQ
jgi:hypothetical protein